MEVVIIIILSIGLIAFLAWASKKNKQKMLESGIMIEREKSFEKRAETITLSNADFETVWNLLKIANYHQEMRVIRTQGLCKIVYGGNGWGAELVKIENTENEKDRYYISFTNWTTKNGTNINVDAMNVFLTTVEKVFLEIDAQAQVRIGERLDYKSKISIF